jgi:quercetin dioxygenase-like cupin family protein
MVQVLRLYEDVLANDAEVSLPARPRMIYVVHGGVTLGDQDLRDDAAFGSEQAVTCRADGAGATVWRFELAAEGDASAASGAGLVSHEKLSARLDTIPKGAVLLRGDSVAFPPGGCAYLHRHQGPGIRCLLHGGIRIDTMGRSTLYGPGDAWYESGPEPVFAQAADAPTRFVRVMILPMAYLARSSVEYLNEEDKAKPKSQSYKIFVDMPIAITSSPA